MSKTILFEEDKEVRLDRYLASILTDYSRSHISRKIKKSLIRVNGHKVKPSYLLENGDYIDIDSLEKEKLELEPENIDLDILYEDDFIILVNKPRGMVVHPGVGNQSGTLVNALLNHTDSLSDLGGDFRPGIVHRLDKETSGLLVVAKDNLTHSFLSEQLKNRKMKREYLLLVEGRLVEDGKIDQPIGRDPSNRLRMCVIDKNSKEAITYYEVLENFDRYTYVRASLYTGRMHQIRVHMQYIGHPIVGDPVYGSGKNEFGLDSQLLHAERLGLVHPVSKEYMEFENHKSRDLERVLQIIREEEGHV